MLDEAGQVRETAKAWKASSYLYPHKTGKVRNVRIVGNLYELISLPNPFEDHDAPISDNTARDEEPVIRSTELHSSNLV